MGNQLSELGQALRSSSRVARHSLARRSRAWPAEQVSLDAGHLALLSFSCIMLMRTIIAVAAAERVRLVARMRQLADILADLGTDLGDIEVRQRAVDRVHHVIRDLNREATPAEVATAGAVESLRIVAYDVMVFAGADPRSAVIAARDGSGELRVAAQRRVGASRSSPRSRSDLACAGQGRAAGAQASATL